jgi:ferredoxin
MNRRQFFQAGASVVSALAAASYARRAVGAALDSPPGEVKAGEQHKQTRPAARFSHKEVIFVRVFWDKVYREARAMLEQRPINLDVEMDGAALNYAGWWMHNMSAYGNANGAAAGGPWEYTDPAMRWDYPLGMDVKRAESYSRTRLIPRGGLGPRSPEQFLWDDKPAENCYKAPPEVLTRKVKEAALFLGCDDVGIAGLNPLWVYADYYDVVAGRTQPWPKDPAQFKNAVSISIRMLPMSFEYYGSAATGLAYSRMIFITSSLAAFIRGLGYPAIPTMNDTVAQTPLAIDAGLGEAGRMSLMISHKLGARQRLGSVLTDIPLIPDAPVSFGVEKFCETCDICASACPIDAISAGEQSDVPRGRYNRSGFKRWQTDAEKCFNFWHIKRSACNICVSVCPFNNRPSQAAMHNAADKLDSSAFNRALAALNSFFG